MLSCFTDVFMNCEANLKCLISVDVNVREHLHTQLFNLRGNLKKRQDTSLCERNSDVDIYLK